MLFHRLNALACADTFCACRLRNSADTRRYPSAAAAAPSCPSACATPAPASIAMAVMSAGLARAALVRTPAASPTNGATTAEVAPPMAPTTQLPLDQFQGLFSYYRRALITDSAEHGEFHWRILVKPENSVFIFIDSGSCCYASSAIFDCVRCSTTYSPIKGLGTDQFGNQWYAKILPDGSHLWGSVRNGVLQNGGLNTTPRELLIRLPDCRGQLNERPTR